jgi:putative Mn2+ efflux pump MntP
MEKKENIKYINKIMVIGTVVNAVITLVTASSDPREMPVVLIFILFFFLAINIAGVVLSIFLKSKTGPRLVMIGSIVFIPIGMIAIFGARKVLDNLKREEINLEG